MMSDQAQKLCYICGPRYAANATTGNGVIPICTVCAWNYKIQTDQEAEEQARIAEAARYQHPQHHLDESWNVAAMPPLKLDVPF